MQKFYARSSISISVEIFDDYAEIFQIRACTNTNRGYTYFCLGVSTRASYYNEEQYSVESYPRSINRTIFFTPGRRRNIGRTLICTGICYLRLRVL